MRVRGWAIAALAGLTLVLAGCGGGDDDSAAPAESTTTEAASTEPLEIAYLSASTANTWLASSKEAMEKFAAENDVTLTEFDAQFKFEEQQKQLQDAIASGKYDGIMLVPLGPGLIPDVESAIDAGLKVGLLNQVLGEKFDTVEPQVEGVSVAVLAPPLRSGERLGELALKACEGKDPCRVVYFYGIKGIPLDVAMKQGFDAVISQNSAIEIVAEGQGQYLGPDVGRKEMQDILQKTPDFDVVVGSDQSMQGVQQALEDAGKLDQVAVIGLGGSEAAIQAVKDGKWFGDVMGAPYTEGELAIKALVEALRNDKDTGGIDPLTTIEDEGLVTQENVSKFEPQWAG